MDSLIKLLIEKKTSFGYKKCKELYSTEVSILAIMYRFVILHRLPTDNNTSGPIYRNMVQYIVDHTVINLCVDIYKASETLLFKPSSFIVRILISPPMCLG